MIELANLEYFSTRSVLKDMCRPRSCSEAVWNGKRLFFTYQMGRSKTTTLKKSHLMIPSSKMAHHMAHLSGSSFHQ